MSNSVAIREYLLPADRRETERLNLQHRIIIRAFENQLAVAPLSLKSGDHVLESGAGSGIWASEFLEYNRSKDVVLNMECIDISAEQFPPQHPPNIHFSLRTITDLPKEWSNTFKYVHQRLLIAALKRPGWHVAITQIYHVLSPGGWVEFVETHTKIRHLGVGPNSNRLVQLSALLYEEKDIVGDLEAYLPPLLQESGFVDIQCQSRNVPVRSSIDGTDTVQQWYDLWRGMKASIIDGGGYGIVKTGEEYESLLLGCKEEWSQSSDAYVTYWAIVARKPDTTFSS